MTLRCAILLLVSLPVVDNAIAVVVPANAIPGDAANVQAAPRTTTYDKAIAPLLAQYCFGCHGSGKHKGDLSLDAWKNEAAALADHKTWERVLRKLQAREMPPENKRQLTTKERALLTGWIERDVLHCDCDHPDPGRVTIRRLNRAEYNNTIRDLIGINVQPAEDFPVDDSGYGFDTIGDALSMPPVLVEKYLAAAQRILDAALVINDPARPRLKRFPVDILELGYNAKQRGDGWVSLNSIEEDDVAAVQPVGVEGEFALRVKAYARPESTNSIKLTFMLDDTPVQVVDVETNQAAPKIYEARVNVPAGKHRFRAVVRRIKDGLPAAEALKWKSGPAQKGAVFVESLELEGPLNAGSRPLPESHRRIFTRQPDPGGEPEAAREILGSFARRAYRRPVTKHDLDRLVDLAADAWKRGDSFEEGLYLSLQAILVSPHFLFRGELQPEPDNPRSIHPVNEHALASRLSYFLWSSMPDDHLFALADRGTLRKNLASEIKRMLRDAKARALVDNFAGQWLQFRNLKLATPDPWLFPEFDDELRAAMQMETELFCEYIIKEDRSVLEFLDADYTFLNERLARHYGMTNLIGQLARRLNTGHASFSRAGEGSRQGLTFSKADQPNGRAGFQPAAAGVLSAKRARGLETSEAGWKPALLYSQRPAELPADDFERVSLKGTSRGGVLTHGSVLTITSNPTRTSPVKRGKWVLENLLGTPPPPPPAQVPDLSEAKEKVLSGTLRQRMERHRADPLCASCHARMDPIGFGLENFNAIGGSRNHDGKFLIDAAGELVSGESFTGAADLRKILIKRKKEQFVLCLSEKMMTYALGRGLEFYDKCAVDQITESLARNRYKLSALVLGIVQSTPFQMRRGEEPQASSSP